MLRAGAVSPARIGRFEREFEPDDFPEPWKGFFEERAAIREFDGGQAKEHAEAEALREVVERMRTAGLCQASGDENVGAGR